MKNIMELTGARLKAAENWYKRQVKNGAQPHCVIDSAVSRKIKENFNTFGRV